MEIIFLMDFFMKIIQLKKSIFIKNSLKINELKKIYFYYFSKENFN